MKINKTAVTSKIRNLSKHHNVPINTILQYYFFDAFIKKLSKSQYSKNFIFKGGFLLSTTIGINFRSTLDMDFSLNDLSLKEKYIQKIFNEIISIKTDDNVRFEIAKITKIKASSDYGGYTISLIGKLENIRINTNVDIATGDPVTPEAVQYKYKTLFDGTTINLFSYNYETILAEKIQTVLYRSYNNSRLKDLYDIYIIDKFRFKEINIKTLIKAFNSTCKFRKTLFDKDSAYKIYEDLSLNNNMLTKWKLFSKKKYFANNIEFNTVLKSLIKFIEFIYK